MIQATDFKNAMSLLTSAVNVVTTSGTSGRHGFTASAVCSVTDTPPTLLVCMNKSARSHIHFTENKVLTVNVLGADHQKISNVFASKMSSEERFKYGSWTELTTGAPVLEDALVSLIVRLTKFKKLEHTLFLFVRLLQFNRVNMSMVLPILIGLITLWVKRKLLKLI